MLEVLDYRPRRLKDAEVPPVGTAEKFIGQVGVNTVFDRGLDGDGRRIYASPYDVIACLNLKLGDPQVDAVRATFSNLTHAAEIRGLADPDYPLPEPGQSFIVPAPIQERAQAGLQELAVHYQRISIRYISFVALFTQQLKVQGMGKLAQHLTQNMLQQSNPSN